MKVLLPIIGVNLLCALMLVSQGFSIPLSDLDLDWFRDNPLDMEWGPDPFVAKIPIAVEGKTHGKKKEPFNLTAVLLGGENQAAILNGAVVHVGDTVLGYRVTRITKRYIYLRSSSGTVQVPLRPLFSIDDQKP
jgi:hypothetical protein